MPWAAAVHGRPGTERLDLNLDTLWSGGPAAPGVWCDPGDVAPLRAAVAAGDHRRADEVARALQPDRWVQAFQPLGWIEWEHDRAQSGKISAATAGTRKMPTSCARRAPRWEGCVRPRRSAASGESGRTTSSRRSSGIGTCLTSTESFPAAGGPPSSRTRRSRRHAPRSRFVLPRAPATPGGARRGCCVWPRGCVTGCAPSARSRRCWARCRPARCSTCTRSRDGPAERSSRSTGTSVRSRRRSRVARRGAVERGAPRLGDA
ncbi:hypothetical protein G3554_15295 [Micromonospora sp. PPF5-17]|nr:hypothetical protein [Micromonospora solifontis]NES58261.1 hypothetical protein [Micromonospora sp. PPF5-6]